MQHRCPDSGVPTRSQPRPRSRASSVGKSRIAGCSRVTTCKESGCAPRWLNFEGVGNFFSELRSRDDCSCGRRLKTCRGGGGKCNTRSMRVAWATGKLPTYGRSTAIEHVLNRVAPDMWRRSKTEPTPKLEETGNRPRGALPIDQGVLRKDGQRRSYGRNRYEDQSLRCGLVQGGRDLVNVNTATSRRLRTCSDTPTWVAAGARGGSTRDQRRNVLPDNAQTSTTPGRRRDGFRCFRYQRPTELRRASSSTAAVRRELTPRRDTDTRAKRQRRRNTDWL